MRFSLMATRFSLMALTALIIACLFEVSLQAQSVADLARFERARRASLPAPGRLITSEQAGLSRGFLSFGSDPSAPAETPGEVPGETSPQGEGEQTDPSTAEVADEASELASLAEDIDRQTELVAELENQTVLQQVEIVRLRELFTAPVASGRERSQAQVELAAAETELEATRIELEAAEALLAELLAEVEAGEVVEP